MPIAAEEVQDKVFEIVGYLFGIEKSEVTREQHLVNDLNADSLDAVELVMDCEDEFDLSVPDEEAEKIQTVGQMVDYIVAHAN